jgi:hypothetical protein
VGDHSGVIAVVWRPDDAIMMRLDELDDVPADAVVGVDPDFGVYGPGVRSLSRGRGEEDDLYWPELAQVLGQPVPYWPYLLRDPDLIEVWEPTAAPVIAPARTDLDTRPLLRMAAMFDPTHATNRTLTNLVRVNQGRASRDALQDLELAAESVQHWTDRHQQAVMVVAAEPLVIGEVNADPGDIDDTVQRIGWIELLGRTDTLSWACVKQALAWDGGKHFPFSSPTEIDPTSAPGREWATRLEPAKARTAEFACINRDGAGDALVDPLTGAPVVRLPDGIVTIVPQRLPTTSPLAEVILGRPIWVRTADGTLYPAPQRRLGLTWGYGGTGPGVLAGLIHRLLDDITAEPADGTTGAPRGLVKLTRMIWPTGVVLSRALLEAARDGRPYDHPAKPG